MQHVRVRMDAGGQETDIHPMYGLLVDAPFVERATALQYNYTDQEMSMLHLVEGDANAFAEAVDGMPAALDFAIERVDGGGSDGGGSDDGRFYAYVRGENTEGIEDMFGKLSESGLVVVPPIVYHEDGTVSASFFGPEEEFQPLMEQAPEALDVSIEAVGGLASTAGVDARLSDRQREAVRTALDLGYYDVPRTASQADVAAAMDCSPSTAAEHLQKAEARLVRGFLGSR